MRDGRAGALRPSPSSPFCPGGNPPGDPGLWLPVWISPQVSPAEGPPRPQRPTQHHPHTH